MRQKQSTTKNSSTKPKTSSQPYLSGADDIQFTMTHATDHDDGSATYNLDMNEYTAGKLIEIGVIALLKEHIEQEKAKKPSVFQRLKKLFK